MDAPPPWPPAASPAPPVQPAPAPPRQHLGYGQFLLRTVTVAVVAPLVAFGVFIAAMVVVIAIIAAALGTDATSSSRSVGRTVHIGGDDGADDVVLVVPVRGPITATTSGGVLLGGAVTSGYDVKDTLQRAARDRDVKAVVIELTTPGGSVTGSEAIADGIEAVKAAGKPVFAHVTELSASGGVWSMVPADRIVADPGSLVGSIGVIFGPFRRYDDVVAVDDGVFLGGVETAGGIEEYYITAGEAKDLGNPYRPMTAEERAHLQSMVDTFYAQFVAHVAEHRTELTPARIRQELGARIFTASQALELGLVDEIAARDQTWASAARAAGIEGYDVREAGEEPSLLGALLGADAPDAPRRADLSGLCTPQAGVLAFHGDLAALCAGTGR